MKPVIILLGGTFVPQALAWHLYDAITKAGGVRFVHALPGQGLASVRQTHAALERNVRACVPSDSRPVELWGHSQGGIHAVMMALTWSNVQRVVTWGTPHHGTLTALPFSSWPVSRIMPVMRDLRLGSAFIRHYEAECLPAVTQRLVSIYGRRDPLVQPYHSAHVAGAVNHLLATANHFAIGGKTGMSYGLPAAS